MRPHPFDLVFGALAPERFPAIRDALVTDRSIAGFLVCRPAIELLHELRPDTGLGDAIDDFVAFVHAAFWYWRDGAQTVALDGARLRAVLEGRTPPLGDGGPPLSVAAYMQLPPRLVWSRVDGAEFHEPIDGWFVLPEGDAMIVVACLGVHAERPGLSVMAARGEPVALSARPDGSARFAPTMDGGAAAGLWSVATAAELLALAAISS